MEYLQEKICRTYVLDTVHNMRDISEQRVKRFSCVETQYFTYFDE